MHKILERQIQHYLGSGENISPQWREFLQTVSDTYTHFDEDRALLDRSLTLSSQEFSENNARLKEAKEKVEEIVKQRTQELREERARLLASIESLSLGFAIFDTRGGIFLKNKALGTILEIEKPQITGIGEMDFFLSGKVKLGPLFEEAMESKRQVYSRNVVFGKKFLRVFVTPISLTATSDIIGAVMVVEDITREQQIDRAKTEFVVLASHQLRTPLTIIKWHVELLHKKITKFLNERDAVKYLKAIEDGTNRMVALVQALLNVSRIEVGKMAVKPEPLNPKHLCQGVLEELRNEIQARQIEVKEEYSNKLPTVVSDPNLFRVILQNLLTNAIKYTPEKGSITLTLGKPLQEEIPDMSKKAEKYFQLTIADTGYGIPKEQQDKIFTKLFRADNVKLTQSSGTGLGLYITKAIVESFNGLIWFQSPICPLPEGYEITGLEGNIGTMFCVILPMEIEVRKEGVSIMPDEPGERILFS